MHNILYYHVIMFYLNIIIINPLFLCLIFIAVTNQFQLGSAKIYKNETNSALRTAGETGKIISFRPSNHQTPFYSFIIIIPFRNKIVLNSKIPNNHKHHEFTKRGYIFTK